MKSSRPRTGQPCKIAAVLSNPKTALKDALRAKKCGADLLEYRFDLMKNTPAADLKLLAEIRQKARLPVIGTIRLKTEGGKYGGSEEARLELFRAFLPRLDFLDIELSSGIAGAVIRLARGRHKKVILSCHNFNKTPLESGLRELAEKAARLHPDIIKIATRVDTPYDFLALAGLLFRYRGRPSGMAVIPMVSNPAYSAFRLLAMALGSSLNYASTNARVAPGQLTLSDCLEFRKASI